MNLLFSKNRKVSLCILCLCAFFYSFKSFGQNPKHDPFVELCKKSDAYYVYAYNDITYSRYLFGYRKHISVNNKVVINTTKGVENYAFLNLDEYQSNHMKSIKIRTLKADGTVVELDSSLVFKRNSKRQPFGAIKYPIPAVEPGDTIQATYVYYQNLDRSDLRGYVNLYTNLPCMNTQYTIKTSPIFDVYYKTYNGFPDPEVVTNDTIVYLQFSEDKIKGLEINEHNCLPCEKPYLYYSLERKNRKIRTWKDVYNEEYNILTQPMALDKEKSSYYKRWKRRVIGKAKDSSKYHKFELLYNEVLQNFKMGLPSSKEIIKSSGYFLKKKQFDPLSIQRFYRQVLEDLEIEYWAVFAKNKRSGPIDTDYIRRGEFDYIFFAYENEKGQMKFIFPHEQFYKYQIDEIPTSLYDTKAVLVKPYLKKKRRRKDKFINRNFKLATSDSVKVATINLPGMNYKYNYIQQSIFSQVNIKDKKTRFKYRFKASGGMSTEIRGFFDMLDKNKNMSDYYDTLSEVEGDNTIQIDTILKRIQYAKKPFSFVVNGEGTLNNVVSFINDSLVSISIDKLIKHHQIENDSDATDLSYYLDYNYSDLLIFYVNFPCKIEVLGLENGKVHFENDFGEYVFTLEQNKDNELKFQSNYKILKSIIPKENLNELKLLNEQIKSIKSKRLIVKLKPTK